MHGFSGIPQPLKPSGHLEPSGPPGPDPPAANETARLSAIQRMVIGRLRLCALLSIALVMLFAAWLIRPSAAISGASPAVGKQAPAMELIAICSGKNRGDSGIHLIAQGLPATSKFKVQSLAFDRCQVCLIHFWGTWCGPCRDEMPELARVYDELEGNAEFQFISISCSSFDDPSLTTLHDRTRRFYETHDIQLPTYADPLHAARTEFLRMMERPNMAYPTTILVDRDGIIRSAWIGVPPGGADTIRKRVFKILNES